MPFSQSAIESVRVTPDGADLLIDWTSSEPEGAVFQVYVDRRLAWFGTSTRCHVPSPSRGEGRNVWVDVGTVPAAEARRDFSGELASLAMGTGVVELSWNGGTYLDSTGNDDVLGFRIYRSPAPGAEVDPTAPVATVPAYPGGWISDGFGLGGFGEGGFGRAAGRYAWSSGALATGTWRFRIVPYDRSGNDRGPGQEVAAVVRAAPRPPGGGQGAGRLTYQYNDPAPGLVTLRWQPSPPT